MHFFLYIEVHIFYAIAPQLIFFKDALQIDTSRFLYSYRRTLPSVMLIKMFWLHHYPEIFGQVTKLSGENEGEIKLPLSELLGVSRYFSLND